MKQTCILVLGMHRSGTSALTGVLSLLDVYLGSELMPASEANEKGYFENNNLYRINEKLLEQVGSSWEDIFFFEDKLKDLIEIGDLKEQLKKDFEYSKTFAIKDPRLAFLFPVYKKVLEELDIEIKIIIPYRNPVEVANSLNKRDGFIFENAMLLWAYHMLLAEKFSRGYKRVFIGFDDLMSDTKNTIKLISKKLDICLDSKYIKKKKKIKNFLEPSLKHHNLSIDNLSDNIPNIVQDILILREIYNQKIAQEQFDRLRVELFDYQKLFYNQSIIKTFSNFKQIQQTLNEKEALLTQNQLALENNNTRLNEKQEALIDKDKQLSQRNHGLKETKVNLAQSLQTIEQQKQELNEKQEALIDKDKQLSQKNHGLEETKVNLAQSLQTIEQQKQELNEKQEALIDKDKQLSQRNHGLEETKANLAQSLQTIEQQKQELNEKQEALIDKDKQLSQRNHGLEETKANLAQSLQTIEQQKQELNEKQEALIDKDKQLEKTEQSLSQKCEENTLYKDELTIIYTSRSWKITKNLRKLRRLFK